MKSIPNRMFRTSCAGCQVGQGRLCQCEGAARVSNGKRRRPRFEITRTSFWWAALIALGLFWTGVLWLLRASA